MICKGFPVGDGEESLKEKATKIGIIEVLDCTWHWAMNKSTYLVNAPWRLSPEALQQLARQLAPTGTADYDALMILSMVAATYLSRGILWDQPVPYRHLLYERPQLKMGGASGAHAHQETRNIAQKLVEAEKNIVICWGSQSGTEEGFAHRLAREIGLRFQQTIMTADLSDYDPDSICAIPETKLAIFLLSRYGGGDPSDNTAEFWDWVQKAPEGSLTNLRYCAFGLGNSNYKFYNRVVDVVVQALDQRGAHALLPVGKANDAEGTTQEDFIDWKDDLFAACRAELSFEEGEAQYLPTLAVDEDESLELIDLHHGVPDPRDASGKVSTQCSPVRAVPISSARQLFSTPDRHCLHLDLDLTCQPELTYKTDDHLAIWPGNSDAEVERLLQVLGRADRREVPIVIRSVDAATKVKIPTPTTPAALFRYYLEIGAPVNRDQAFLLRLGQNKAAYADFLRRTHVNLGRLLQLAVPDQTWTQLPLSYRVETMASIQPRYYSISSSSVLSPRKPSITVLVASNSVPENSAKLIHGVTSNYLLALAEHRRDATSGAHPRGLTYYLPGPSDALAGGQVLAHLRKSKFKLPRLASSPLIMVAAGTGLAPFRALIAERRQLQQVGRDIGEMILIFGCRRPDEDSIYREELEALQSTLGDRLRIVTAFSREDVIRLIEEGANVYICERAGMAREVEKTVGRAMRKTKGRNDGEGNDWSKAFKRKGKWQEDVWG
ncbi:NADPH cytochrome P450 oxidoreductase family protein [Aspergillus homomorphus CBS 101889]|uniref:NADPH--cytochrome P450 reductase n=1 Tax=Aspergillus homomorphus (strain CBS 101889) TaxID=1450537 RepID=A0A395I4D3_ASPHC|nr:NADPH-cytochrome P450 reductase [Aspergillus homomorphus CBS 101889]RAL15061.1 NADPH-cytochrome P450 reductase [Aspergillus homomorphus CBS 101889]